MSRPPNVRTGTIYFLRLRLFGFAAPAEATVSSLAARESPFGVPFLTPFTALF